MFDKIKINQYPLFLAGNHAESMIYDLFSQRVQYSWIAGINRNGLYLNNLFPVFNS